MVTSVPLTSKSGFGAWGIPLGIHPLIVALGRSGAGPAWWTIAWSRAMCSA